MAEVQFDQSRLDKLAEAFVERYRRGERPAISEYQREHPDLAKQIEELFPALAMMEQAESDLRKAARKSTEAAEPTAPITQLGDFRIIREIGRGGMGVVYEAEQISLGRRVALKVLPKPMLADAKHRKRFEREARAAGRLHHTNIVPVYGVGEQDGLHYYVMQFIHGLALDEVLIELKRLRKESEAAKGEKKSSNGSTKIGQAAACGAGPGGAATLAVSAVGIAESLVSGRFERAPVEKPETGSENSSDAMRNLLAPEAEETIIGRRSETLHGSGAFALPGQNASHSKSSSRNAYWQSVARIGVQAADALHYAHEHGIIHRDVKPGNLLLDTRGGVWVTDFGLAKAADQQNLTHTGDVLGTLRYMAPEQFDGKADPCSDVYSLGLTLYELLALQPAFDAFDRRKLIKQLATGAPPRLRTIDPHIPRDLETVVHKAIDRDPSHRYPTATEMAADLERYLANEPIRAKWASPATRFRRWCKRNPMVASLTTIIALLTIAAAVISSVAAIRFEKLATDNARLAGNLKAALADAEHNLQLMREQEQIAQENLTLANSEKQRAEDNLDLALQALDAVYLDAIGTRKLLNDPESDSPMRAPLTDLEKELLRRGLEFYDQFARQNAATPRAAVLTAKGYHRVGAMQGALGETQLAEDAYLAAIERFAKLAEAQPDVVDHLRDLANANMDLASIVHQRRNARPFLKQAAEFWRQVLAREAGKRDASAYYGRANVYLALDMPRNALSDANKAVELSATYQNLMLRGEILSELHQIDAALADYSRAIGTQPRRGAAYAKRGVVFLKTREYARALEDYERALSVEPMYWMYKLRAYALFRLGEYEKSLRDLQKALELTPWDTSTLFWVPPRLVLRSPDPSFREGVLELAATAVDQSSDPEKARRHRSWVYLGLNRWTEARADLELLLAENANPHDHYRYALMWLAVDDHNRYRQACKTMLDRFADTDDPMAAQLTAWTCAILPNAIEDYESAIALAEKSLHEHPYVDQCLSAQGILLFRAGRRDEAVEVLSKLVDRQTNPETRALAPPAKEWCVLAMAHHQGGQREIGLEHLTKAVGWFNRTSNHEAEPPEWDNLLTLRLLKDEAESTLQTGR